MFHEKFANHDRDSQPVLRFLDILPLEATQVDADTLVYLFFYSNILQVQEEAHQVFVALDLLAVPIYLLLAPNQLSLTRSPNRPYFYFSLLPSGFF